MQPPKEVLIDFIQAALVEDVGEGDHTSLACIPEGKKSKAILLAKDFGMISGVEFAKFLLHYIQPDIEVDIHVQDGAEVHGGEVVFTAFGLARHLLMGERLLLNVMQRMSGISTMASQFVAEVEGLPTKILDTRKTTPLNRWLEKWAVAIGGCENYRFGLFDRIMIKDNHIDACGGISQAIDQVQAYLSREGLDLEITIEVRNLNELHEVLQKGKVNRIMLDNFEIPILREAVEIIDRRYETEASGGIVLNTVRSYAETGVDYISSGALTHTIDPLDLSFKIVVQD